MSQWIIQIETTADGRYQWRHVPAEGTGTGSASPHSGHERFDSAEEALAAGQAALARHHETPLGAGTEALPETPEHPSDTRLGESQSQLQAQEDPRLPSDSPVSISNLPVEALVRTADVEGTGIDRR